jgi:HD superfamily phosphodiesterase
LLGIRDGLKCDSEALLRLRSISESSSVSADRELLYLGAIMHDLGLTERFDAEQRFEVNGADAARAFVLEHGLSDEKAEIVWDANDFVALALSHSIPRLESLYANSLRLPWCI